MNFYALSALINAITSLVLGSFVFFKNPKNQTSNLFVFLSASVFIWSFFYFLWQISNDYDSSLVYTRILSIGSTMIPILYLHWVLSFLELNSIKRKIILSLGYAATFVFLVFSFSPIFIQDVGKILNFSYWPRAGYLYTIYIFVSYGCFVSYGIIELIKNYFSSSSLRKYQIKYILFGSAIGFLGGATNFFLWYGIKIPPFGNIFVSLYVFFLFYAMAKYRLMDIRIMARKIFIYIGVAAFTYGMFYLLIWFYGYFMGGFFTNNSYAFGLLIAPLFALGFYAVDRGMRIFANKYLFVTLYNYQETINKLTDELTNYIDLNKIIDLIVDTIKKTMQLDRAGVLLVSTDETPVHYQVAKIIGFKESNDLSLVQDSFLIKYLSKTQKPLVSDELLMLSNDAVSSKEKQSFARLYDHMNRIEASLCLPLMSNKKLIGIIVLGSKISGDAYTKEDLELLNTLSNQAGITIENARQYKQIQQFGKTLQIKVNEQTKDLQENKKELEVKNQTLEKQAEHLQKLLVMRSEFLDIASHQLKTPVSVIMGTAVMFKEGSMAKLTKEQQVKFVDNILQKSKKLRLIINDILRASEMDTENFKLGNIKKPFSLVELLDKLYKEFKIDAGERKLNVVWKKPVKDVTMVGDEDLFGQAISNLLDNAIKYTKEGDITLSLQLAGKRAIIEVSDHGIGIPADDQKKIFDKFGRAKNAVNMYTDGSGLGLFIVKKIIEAHGGKISFKSQEGKGTTFTAELPLVTAKSE